MPRNSFFYSAYLCVYNSVKTRKNGSFVKEKNGGYTYERQHCKSIVFKYKKGLKDTIGMPPTDKKSHQSCKPASSKWMKSPR